MRIVSKWKDYYDAVQGYGLDHSLTYVRNLETVECPVSFPSKGINSRFKVILYIVGFCGKVYPCAYLCMPDEETPSFFGVRLNDRSLKEIVENRRISAKTIPLQDAFCYDIKDVDRFAEKNLSKKRLEEYYQKDEKKSRRWPWTTIGVRQQFEEFFDSIEKIEDKHVDLFQKFKSPIFIIDPNSYESKQAGGWPRKYKTLLLNPCLKDIEFAKKIEPYTAFQNLEMFLSNIARPEPDVPVPTDKDMVEIKGFDKKWSFRKKPNGH